MSLPWLWVCELCQLQLLQGKSQSRSQQLGWAALNRHRNWEKSLEIPVFGWTARDHFVFKDTQLSFFSRFIPQSRGRIAKRSKNPQILGQIFEQIKAAGCDWDEKLLWNENQYTIYRLHFRLLLLHLPFSSLTKGSHTPDLSLFPLPFIRVCEKGDFVVTQIPSSVRSHSRRLFSGIWQIRPTFFPWFKQKK